MGICWGGLLAANYLAERKAPADGLILLSPAIYRRVNFNRCVKLAAKVCHFLNPEIRFKIPIKDEMFTSNKSSLDFIKKDTMRLRSLTTRFFNEIQRMERELSPVNHKINAPVCILLAGHDEIVHNERIMEWFKRLESTDKVIKVFNDLRHVMPFEEDIEPLIDFITDWIKMREPSFERQDIKD